MSANWFIDSALVLVGIGTLVLSLFTISRIINELGSGILKRRWFALRLLVAFFIIGYIGYWSYLPRHAQFKDLLGTLILFLGALFVLIVSWLMLQTTRDIKRVASLELQSITDPLLGIYNRRYLDQRLSEEISRAQRYKFPLSILMLDIDHFKRVNDRFGHLTGDKVLISIGKLLQEKTRQSDIVARYGGEEIVLMLPNTNEDRAVNLAERLRVILEQTPYTAENNSEAFHCTVSIGVTSLGEESCKSSDLLRKADVALYQAKRTGRNKVLAFKPEYDKKNSG